MKRKEGYSIMECSREDEFAVCAGVPFEGSVLHPGAPIVKLHFSRSVLQEDLKTLSPEIELAVKKIYNKFIKSSDEKV